MFQSQSDPVHFHGNLFLHMHVTLVVVIYSMLLIYAAIHRHSHLLFIYQSIHFEPFLQVITFLKFCRLFLFMDQFLFSTFFSPSKLWCLSSIPIWCHCPWAAVWFNQGPWLIHREREWQIIFHSRNDQSKIWSSFRGLPGWEWKSLIVITSCGISREKNRSSVDHLYLMWHLMGDFFPLGKNDVTS